MGAVLEIDGLVFVEEQADVLGKLVAPERAQGLPPMAQREFHARMENWRRVVTGGGGSSASVCASWARWYVALRTSEEPPQQDVLDEKYKPPRPLVSADDLDGWLVEEAYRKLSDFNDRMALKCRHIYGFNDARTRTRLKGVRGSYVRLVIARAENNLKTILKSFE